MEEKSIKVLVCDDSILIRKQLKDCLASLGCHDVREAFNGVEAIELYKEFKPNLVFMDIVMPEKSGIDAVNSIMEFDNKAKIVMLSSSGTKTHLKKAIEAGAYEFIQKPFDEVAIKGVIDNI